MKTYDIPTDEASDLLSEIINQCQTSNLLTIPGIYEILSEHFNNEIIAKWEENHPEAGRRYEARVDPNSVSRPILSGLLPDEDYAGFEIDAKTDADALEKAFNCYGFDLFELVVLDTNGNHVRTVWECCVAWSNTTKVKNLNRVIETLKERGTRLEDEEGESPDE